jgi:hypothetical protein
VLKESLNGTLVHPFNHHSPPTSHLPPPPTIPYSFHSYSLRRLNDPTRRHAPAPNKQGTGDPIDTKDKKESKDTTDPTDTMALLLPCVTEVDLWPALLVRSTFLKEAKGVPALRCLENAVCDLGLMLFASADTPTPPSTTSTTSTTSTPSASIPGLIPYIPFSLHPQLAARKPTEQQIDLAAAADPELF